MMKVIFVCIHNSARSQMAEAWLRKFGGDSVNVQSAGLKPGKLNPLVVQVMQEVGIDISAKKTQTVDDVLKRQESFDFVITVCDAAHGEQCPIFPGKAQRLHWGFEDPSSLEGELEEKLSKIRIIRDAIRIRIQQWVGNDYEVN